MTRPKFFALATLGLVLVFSGCGKKVDDTAITAADLARDSTSLTYKLAAEKSKLSEVVPTEVLAVGQRFREAQSLSGILDSALNVGDMAPSFALTNAVGDTVKSEDLLAKGPIVLTFYRGQW